MISFVYFDLGGVAMLDFSGTNKWHELMCDLRIPENRMQEVNQLFEKYRPRAGKGEINLDTEIDIIKQELHLSIPNAYSLLDDLVSRFEKNSSIWPVIAKIHKIHRVGLLTNMFIGMFDKIVERGLLPNEKWDVIVDSSIVHLLKPNRDMYEFAQQQAGVPNNEIFFVDNLEENILATQQLGWQTFLYDSKNLEESSQKLLKLFTK